VTARVAENESRRSEQVALAALLLLFGAFWCWLSVAVHTVEIPGGESDRYVLAAERVMSGVPAMDAYHPIGYPLLLAGLGWLGLDLFWAGKLVSILGGLVLVACCHQLARRWLPPSAALLAALAVGASEFVLFGAVQACPDVAAAALVAVALACWTTRGGEPSTSRLLAAGFALGVATSFRVPAAWCGIGLLPLLARARGPQRRRVVVYTGAALLLGVSGHLAYCTWQFGTPFANANWHNLVLKYYHHFDTEAWIRDHDRLGAIMAEHWPSWLLPAGREVGSFLVGGLASGIAGGRVGFAISVLLLLGMLRSLWSRDVGTRVLALVGFTYAVLLAATFQPVTRLTIPLLVPVVLSALIQVRRLASMRARWLTTAVAAVLAGFSLVGVPAELRMFELVHPRAELAAIAKLGKSYGEPIHCFYRPSFCFAASVKDPWAELRSILATRQMEFAILSRKTSPLACAELSAAAMPDDFVVLPEDELLVIAWYGPGGRWLERADVSVDGDQVQLRLQLRPDLRHDDVLACGFLFRQPDGQSHVWQRLVLPPTGADAFGLAVPLAAWQRQRIRFVPVLVTKSGVIRRGEPFDVDL
jgi:hypothetical protein